jgi:hypothetical protein
MWIGGIRAALTVRAAVAAGHGCDGLAGGLCSSDGFHARAHVSPEGCMRTHACSLRCVLQGQAIPEGAPSNMCGVRFGLISHYWVLVGWVWC